MLPWPIFLSVSTESTIGFTATMFFLTLHVFVEKKRNKHIHILPLLHWEQTVETERKMKCRLDCACLPTFLKNRSFRTENATNTTRYLPDNEELSIIQLCCLLGAMGYGITCDELQEIVSNLTNFDVNERESQEVSDKVVRGLFCWHGELLKIVQGSSLDPKHAKQANKETWDGMFTKLDSMIHLLHAMGLVPWQNYQDIPPIASSTTWTSLATIQRSITKRSLLQKQMTKQKKCVPF